MIFVMDVGNTNIKSGLFEGKKLINSWRIDTDMKKTSDEYGVLISSFFNYLGISKTNVDGVIISSVIPSINYTLEHMFEIYFKKQPMFVGPGIKTGMNIRYDNPKDLGSDRIVNAIAAFEYYGGPCIVIDFGTATTFGVISENGEFCGGCICPGVKISAEALTSSAAKLPKVELEKPDKLICHNTVAGMQAGIVYGYVGLVDYIVAKLLMEIGDPKAKVIATGGMAQLIASESTIIKEINSLLTLQGLRIVYERNIAG